MKNILLTSICVFALSSTTLFAQSTNRAIPMKTEPVELVAIRKATIPVKQKKIYSKYTEKSLVKRSLIDKELVSERKSNGSSSVSVISYPNPFTNDLTVSISDASSINSIYTASLFDLQGRKVLSQEMNSQSEKLNAATLASGLYILVVQKNGAIVLQEKAIKQ